MVDSRTRRKAAWRGAKLGAILFGLLGFVTGMTICIAWKLPIPPLFITEMGILTGGSLGAMIGWTWHTRSARLAWLGSALGLLGAGLTCSGHPLLVPLYVAAGGVVGHLSGQSGPPRGEAAWRVHR